MTYRYIWKIKLDPKYSEEEFVKFWRETSQILQEYPGAKGTKMTKVEGEARTYLAIAEWESKAARDFMSQDSKAGKSERSKRWLKYSSNDHWGKTELVATTEEIGEVNPVK